MKVAVMGYGTIGSGVVRILEENAGIIAARVGEPLELKKVLDLRDFAGDPIQEKVVHDYKDISEDEEIDLVVETMGGVEPAYTFVRAMLESGKHVTTSNKALVADKGAELLAIAREKGVNFEFEASVGGGIPIIRTIMTCLTGDRILEIAGIVNGTTNYMMTEMLKPGTNFNAALKDAQDKGYAEKDPTADIEGYDACRKIAILTSLVAGQQVDYGDIPTEGISKITTKDFAYAKKMGRAIKLIALSKAVDDTYAVRVAPFLVPEDNPLYAVHGVFNAVLLESDMLGESMYYGSGAGSLPTASAVVADLVNMAKNLDKNLPVRWEHEKLTLADAGAQSYRYFVRTVASPEEVGDAFGSVSAVDAKIAGEIGFVTEEITEDAYNEAVQELGTDKVVGMLRLL